MAKRDCSKTDIYIAEFALWIAQDPKFTDAESVAAEMSRVIGKDIALNDVAKAVTTYLQISRDREWIKSEKNQSKIKSELRSIFGRNRDIDMLSDQIKRGVFAERHVSEKERSNALKVLDTEFERLNEIKASELRAQHHEKVYDRIKSGEGVLPAELRQERYKGTNEELWSTRAQLAKQEASVNEKLKTLQKLELPQKKVSISRRGVRRQEIIRTDAESAQIQSNIDEAKLAVKREQARLSQMKKNNDLYEKLERLRKGEAINRVIPTPKERNELQAQLQKQISDIQKINKLKADIKSQREQLETGVFDIKPTKEMKETNDEILKLRKTKRILGNKIRAKMDEANQNVIWKAYKEVNNIMRVLGASGDLPLGRQGAFYLFSHPRKAMAITKKTIMESWKEADMNRIEQEWKQHPLYEDFIRLKLIRDSEENFEDMKWFNKHPKLTYLYHVSARQQHIMMTEMRMNMYNDMVTGLPIDGIATEKQKKDIANMVLIATGVGQSKFLDQNADVLAQGFFAPKYTLSRIQLATPGYATWGTDPDVRWAIQKEYIRALTGFAAFSFALQLIAGNLGWDEEEESFSERLYRASTSMFTGTGFTSMASSNLGKVRQGHTRIDIGAGIPSVLVPLYQSLPLTPALSSRTGEEMRTDNILTNFFRKRLAPLPSHIASYALYEGKNVVGKDISPIRDGAFNQQGLSNLAWGTLAPYALPAMMEITQDPDSELAFKMTALIMSPLGFGGSMYDAPGEPILPSEDGVATSGRSLYRSVRRDSGR